MAAQTSTAWGYHGGVTYYPDGVHIQSDYVGEHSHDSKGQLLVWPQGSLVTQGSDGQSYHRIPRYFSSRSPAEMESDAFRAYAVKAIAISTFVGLIIASGWVISQYVNLN
jgi:hypothetical protein